MRKILLILGIVAGGSVLFVGASMLILKLQGRLEGESLKSLNQNPVLGAFMPQAPSDIQSDGADPSSASQKKAEPSSKASFSTSSSDPLARPGGFSRRELMEMVQEVREAKARNEKEWSAIELEKVNLAQLGGDLAERKEELSKTMSELAASKAELEALREEFRQELLSIEENEEKTIRKLAEMFESMEEDAAATKLDTMDIDLAVKVIYKMDSAKAAKIIPFMEAERVKTIVDKISRFQERKKN